MIRILAQRGTAPSSTVRRWTIAAALSAATVGTIGVVAVPAGAATGSAVVTAPATIPSNCTRDVTSALASWIAAQPSGSTLQLAANGCYEVDGSLALTNRVGITLDGNGAMLQAKQTSSSSAALLALVGGSNLRVQNLTIIGTNPAPKFNSSLAWSAGVKVAGVAGATLSNVNIQHVYGDFLTLTDNGKTPATNVTVTGGRYDTSGRQGIAIIDARGVDINGVTLGNTGLDTYDLEGNTGVQGASDVTIENTTSYGTGKIWFSAGGNSTSNTGNVVVRNNTMTTTQAGDVINMWAPSGYTKGGFSFVGNTLNAGASSSVSALQLTRVSNLRFDNNVVNFANAGMPAQYTHESIAYLYDCSNIESSGNVFNGPGTPLLKAYNSTGTSSANTVR